VTVRVIGLDLSLASTGIAAIGPAGVAVDRVLSRSVRGPSLSQRRDRLTAIRDNIKAALFDLGHTARTLVVVEGPSLGQARQAGQHDRAGLWWLVVDWLHDWSYPTAEIPPASLKKYATGKGNASKDAVLAAAIRRYPMADITGNDVADAVVLAAMGAHHLGVPLATVPALHATALAKVTWPASNLERIAADG